MEPQQPLWTWNNVDHGNRAAEKRAEGDRQAYSPDYHSHYAIPGLPASVCPRDRKYNLMFKPLI